MYVAEIVGVSESEFDAILSEKSPPNGKRGTSGVYYSAFGESLKQSLQKSCFVQQLIKRSKIQLMRPRCSHQGAGTVYAPGVRIYVNSARDTNICSKFCRLAMVRMHITPTNSSPVEISNPNNASHTCSSAIICVCFLHCMNCGSHNVDRISIQVLTMQH